MLLTSARVPGQYKINSNSLFLCFDLSCIKFLINTREKQELPGIEYGTSVLLAFSCLTEPSTPRPYIYIIYIFYILNNMMNTDDNYNYYYLYSFIIENTKQLYN